MATVAELLVEMLKNVGYDTNKPEMVSFLSSTALNIPIPDDAAKDLRGKLYTQDSAQNHIAIEAHYRKNILKEAEAELQAQLISAGYFQPDEIQAAWTPGSKITDKVNTLMGKLNAKVAAAAANGGATDKQKGDIADLNRQIAELNAQIHKSQLEYAQKEAALKADFTGQMSQAQTNWKKQVVLSAVPVTDALAAVSATDRAAMLSLLIDAEIQQKQLKLVDENGTLTLKTSGGQDYYHNNQPVSFDSLVVDTLKAKGLYKVSNGTPPANQAAQQNGQNMPTNGQAAQQTGHPFPTLMAHLQKNVGQ